MSEKEKTKTVPPRYIYTYNQFIKVSNSPTNQRKIFSRSPATDFINEIVNSIANGLDINSVDPLLYSIILNSLETKRDDFLFGANKNLSAAKMTSRAIDKIHRYFLTQDKKRKRLEEIEKSKKNEAQFCEMQKQNSKVFSRKDIKKAVSIIMEYEKDQSNTKLIQLIDPDIHSYLIDELRALKADALLRNDFKMAEKLENSARLVILLKSENEYNEITNSHAAELQQKYTLALDDYKKLQISWQQKINTMNQQIDNQIKDIQNETDQILIELDKQFIPTTNDTPRTTSNISIQTTGKIEQSHSNFELERDDNPFTKFRPSAKLLELRKSEKSLAFTKRFEEARVLKKQNDRLEQIERNEFISRFNGDLEKRRKEIIKKQQNAIDIVYQKGQQKLAVLTKQMNDQLGQAELSLRHLEDSLNGATKIASLSSLPNSEKSNSRCHFSLSKSDDKKDEENDVVDVSDHKNELKSMRSKSFSHFEREEEERKDVVKGAKSEGTLEMHPLRASDFQQLKNERVVHPCKTSREKSRRRPCNQQWEQNLFYKRRMINNIVYSNSPRQMDLKRSVRFS